MITVDGKAVELVYIDKLNEIIDLLKRLIRAQAQAKNVSEKETKKQTQF